MSNIIRRALLQNKSFVRVNSPIKANLHAAIRPSTSLMTKRSKVSYPCSSWYMNKKVIMN